jgi:hypothetical protein
MFIANFSKNEDIVVGLQIRFYFILFYFIFYFLFFLSCKKGTSSLCQNEDIVVGLRICCFFFSKLQKRN